MEFTVVVKNTFLEVIPKMEEKLESRPRSCPIMRSRNRTSGKEHFRVDVCVPLDPIDVSCDSSTEILGAEERDQVQKMPRPCKGKRNRYKKLVQRLQTQIMANPGGFTMDDIVLPPNLLANHTQRLKLIDRMKRYQQEVLTSCSPYSGH